MFLFVWWAWPRSGFAVVCSPRGGRATLAGGVLVGLFFVLVSVSVSSVVSFSCAWTMLML